MRPGEEIVGPGSDEAALDEVVRSIGDHARTANLARAADLSAAVEVLTSGELGEDARLRAAERAHQIVGSAGTFGFAGVSVLAAELEHFFVAGAFDPVRTATARAQLGELLAQLDADPAY